LIAKKDYLTQNFIPMRTSKTLIAFFMVGLMSIAMVGCDRNECKDVVCSPCPSSRFVMEYQDSLGNCIPAFNASARVFAISASNPLDTAYSYSFSDSCKAGFLIDEAMVYHVVGGVNTRDVISFLDVKYQDPVEVTTCCLCYPVSTLSLSLNGDTIQVSMPAGSYENNPYVRVL
jgi:hypothetical protein